MTSLVKDASAAQAQGQTLLRTIGAEAEWERFNHDAATKPLKTALMGLETQLKTTFWAKALSMPPKVFQLYALKE